MSLVINIRLCDIGPMLDQEFTDDIYNKLTAKITIDYSHQNKQNKTYPCTITVDGDSICSRRLTECMDLCYTYLNGLENNYGTYPLAEVSQTAATSDTVIDAITVESNAEVGNTPSLLPTDSTTTGDHIPPSTNQQQPLPIHTDSNEIAALPAINTANVEETTNNAEPLAFPLTRQYSNSSNSTTVLPSSRASSVVTVNDINEDGQLSEGENATSSHMQLLTDRDSTSPLSNVVNIQNVPLSSAALPIALGQSARISTPPPVARYVEHSDVTSLSHEQSDNIRRDELHSTAYFMIDNANNVGKYLPRVARQFVHTMSQNPKLLQQLEDQFKTPTAVQAQMIPAILQGYDVVVVGQADTGRTSGYLLACLNHLNSHSVQHNDNIRLPRILVVSPNRHLATKIYEKMVEYANLDFGCVLINGELNNDNLIAELNCNLDMIIATPHYLIEAVRDKLISLDSISLCIYDDLEYILDGSFDLQQFTDAVGAVGRNFQTVAITVDIRENVTEYLKTVMTDPIVIRDTTIRFYYVNENGFKQVTYVMDKEHRKAKHITGIIAQQSDTLTYIVVCKDDASVNKVVPLFSGTEECAFIHSDDNSLKCLRAKNSILRKQRKYFVLPAVMLRTLQLDDKTVDCLIFYDMPHGSREYLHILHLNFSCMIVNLIGPYDKYITPSIQKVMNRCHQPVTNAVIEQTSGVENLDILQGDYFSHGMEKNVINSNFPPN